MKDLVVVMDCGATNATVVAVDEGGRLVASASRPNVPVPQPGGSPGWLIWDLEEVWGKLADACTEVCAQVGGQRVAAVAVTTFGADGAPVRADGGLAYPVISWQCPRTAELARDFARCHDPWEAYRLTGYQVISFNTLLKFMWLRQHAPAALESTRWLMMAGLLSRQLCGEASVDPTAACTTMAMDLAQRDWSPQMLALAGVDPSWFPAWREPGQVIGQVHAQAAQRSGLPPGALVVAAGHDTQFAIIGSGAAPGEAILSSGTWEILALRANKFLPNREGFEQGLIVEADAQAGYWNPQMLMIASGVLEWVRRHFWGQAGHETMIAQARQVEPGAGGVMVLPSFVAGVGPAKSTGALGTITGLTITTQPAAIYRAALEGLSFQLRHALDILTRCTGEKPQAIRLVGGGAKNALWNQVRADVTGLPVVAVGQQEATVLGAARFCQVAAGLHDSLQAAGAASADTTYQPQAAGAYQALYQRYLELPQLLAPHYRAAGS